ncbi:MAG: succinylglutamate desuccinylase/aspartoacylase family protein [Halolamina sp.]
MHVGSADASPGELERGWLSITELPTGASERLPVVVAEGVADGPTLWLTGGVHGDEATGVAVAQDALSEALPERLAGTVVSVPVVSPAGLRRNARHTYYGDDDPNRHFPDPEADFARPAEVQERIDRRLYEVITGAEDEATRADAYVDLHTAGVGSVPFSIRDRVLYGQRRSEADAESLAAELRALVAAFGLPVVTEYPAEEYVDQSLQRSTAGAVLNAAGVPSFTAELGSHSVVEEAARAAGVAGVYGVLVELGMVDREDVPETVGDPGAAVPDQPVDYPVRRYVGPRTETAGLVRHRVAAGDVVESGDVVADVVSPTGEQLDTVCSDHDGYVLGRAEGLAAYEGDAVARLAVRDDGDLVASREGDSGDEP